MSLWQHSREDMASHLFEYLRLYTAARLYYVSTSGVSEGLARDAASLSVACIMVLWCICIAR